ncbi:AP-1 complex subunit mu-2 [Artemisia annua]|uniref:AP-1 complex subunit mu-2 n=1 Tax=Artemisia annua TaxID=35608 RepID=A0A2U1PL52_ARTAN|nr:AP-1 complex subunit mu-2 [Artemisia annua]
MYLLSPNKYLFKYYVTNGGGKSTGRSLRTNSPCDNREGTGCLGSSRAEKAYQGHSHASNQHELLDEMMDFGYRQYTEAQIISEFIKTGAYKLEGALINFMGYSVTLIEQDSHLRHGMMHVKLHIKVLGTGHRYPKGKGRFDLCPSYEGKAERVMFAYGYGLEATQEVHLDYLEAGAGIITLSYQAIFRGLRLKGLLKKRCIQAFKKRINIM